MRKFFKIFFSVVVILYFSATMFYCFVAGTPEAGTIAANHVDQIQLAMGKSIAGYNFDHGHYSPGFARMIRKKLDEKSK